MSQYSEFFLSAGRAVVGLDLISITHSSFTKDYFLVRNARDGITVTLETLVEQDFEYLPMKLSNSGSRSDMDFGISVGLGDLGDIMATEIANVLADDTFDERPIFTYRAYRSDDLSAPMFGPIVLTIESLSTTIEGASFEAIAQYANRHTTGEIYDIERFPALRAFL